MLLFSWAIIVVKDVTHILTFLTPLPALVKLIQMIIFRSFLTTFEESCTLLGRAGNWLETKIKQPHMHMQIKFRLPKSLKHTKA